MLDFVYVVYSYTRRDEDKEIEGAFTDSVAASRFVSELNKIEGLCAYVTAVELDALTD